MSITDLRNRARLDLHNTLKMEATLYDKAGGYVGLIHVRKNSSVKPVGDLAGTNLSYAEVAEPVTSLIFLRSEHVPSRGEMVILSANEGYDVDTVSPPDGITQTADVSRMSAADLAGKTAPEDL